MKDTLDIVLENRRLLSDKRYWECMQEDLATLKHVRIVVDEGWLKMAIHHAVTEHLKVIDNKLQTLDELKNL